MANHEQGHDVTDKVKMGVAGILAGFVNGLLGSGGGVLIVLYLTMIAKVGRKNAQATAIAIILPLAVLSSVFYARGGYIVWSICGRFRGWGCRRDSWGCAAEQAEAHISEEAFWCFSGYRRCKDVLLDKGRLHA